MATITGHYNVTVESRYYAFLQDDMESAEPHVLMATAERKRELRKESKTKAKKEKKNKHNTELKVDDVKIESNVEEIVRLESELDDCKDEQTNKPEITVESMTEEKQTENKYERSNRGRGAGRRQNGGPRRGGFPRNEERTYHNDNEIQQKSQENGYNRFAPSNRGRPFRKERSEGDNYNKVGYFEDNSGASNRGNPSRRRPSRRGGGRFNRGNDRPVDDDSLRTDIIPENMGTFEEMGAISSTRPPRSSRGRYPRSNRGGFTRFSNHPQDVENDFENNRIGYFDENMENREFRGSRGRPRSSRGIRRGRGDYWRQRGPEREENQDEGLTNNFKSENRDVPTVEKWPEVDEEVEQVRTTSEPNIVDSDVIETDFNDIKKSNWGEIEDDPVELKPASEHMTLEEWRALHAKDRLLNQEGKENRKANDGQDVFSGMEEYRKGRIVEEQGDDHDVHESQPIRQNQPIPIAIRFSRNTEYGDANNFEQTNSDNRNFSRGYFKNENKFRSDNSAGGRGRSRGGSDFNTYGRGRDFNRGRGRFTRNSYPVKKKEDQDDGNNINLGNEDEFPTLS